VRTYLKNNHHQNAKGLGVCSSGSTCLASLMLRIQPWHCLKKEKRKKENQTKII
jgi:hypothetical protein